MSNSTNSKTTPTPINAPATEIDIDLNLTGNIEVPKSDDKTFLLPQEGNKFYGWLPKFFTSAKSTNEASEWISNRRKGLQSWRDFVKVEKFKVPTSVSTTGRRIVKNLEQFQSNYICIFVLLLLYCILTSPLLLLALAFACCAFYFIRSKIGNKSIKIGNFQFGTGFQYLAVGILSFPLLYVAGVGSAIFWVIGASIFFVGLHAIFYSSESAAVPNADFEMEQV